MYVERVYYSKAIVEVEIAYTAPKNVQRKKVESFSGVAL